MDKLPIIIKQLDGVTHVIAQTYEDYTLNERGIVIYSNDDHLSNYFGLGIMIPESKKDINSLITSISGSLDKIVLISDIGHSLQTADNLFPIEENKIGLSLILTTPNQSISDEIDYILPRESSDLIDEASTFNKIPSFKNNQNIEFKYRKDNYKNSISKQNYNRTTHK